VSRATRVHLALPRQVYDVRDGILETEHLKALEEVYGAVCGSRGVDTRHSRPQ
jgi:hypothetical protein